MADLNYDTGGTGSYTTLDLALAAVAATGDRIFVDNTSNETVNTGTTQKVFTASATYATPGVPQQLICVDDFTTPALTTGATLKTTNNGGITFSGNWLIDGTTIEVGVGGVSGGTPLIQFGDTSGSANIIVNNTTLKMSAVSGAGEIRLGHGASATSIDSYQTKLQNVTVAFANVGHTIKVGTGNHKITNLILSGTTAPTNLFEAGSNLGNINLSVEDSDLTGLAWSYLVECSSVSSQIQAIFYGCILPAGWGSTVGVSTSIGQGCTVTLVGCTSGDVGYAFEQHQYAGTVLTDTGKYISGSAMQDSGTPISRKLTPNSGCGIGYPLTTDLLYPVDNDASIQPWVEITSNVTLTNADCYITVNVMDTNGNTLGSEKTTHPGLIVSGTTLTTSSASWTSGSTYNYKIQLGAAITARQNQLIKITVNLAKSTGSPVVYVGDYGI